MTVKVANGPVSHAALRELNRAHVLEVIRGKGPISRSDLVRQTQLAKPTVTAIVQDLLSAAIVREQGTRPAHGGSGRPAILLEFNPRHQLVVGCHIGNRQITAMVADLDGSPVAVRSHPAATKSVRLVLDRLAELISAALADAAASEPPRAVGVSMPGQIDSTGTCLHAFARGWSNIPVADLLSERLQVPVSVHNDAKAAVMAEVAEGAASGVSDVALLFEDQGIGTAIISGGNLLHGARGAAGEIGHSYVPGATGRCNCGKTGCLETVCSAPALAVATRKLLGREADATLPRHPGLADLARLGRADVDTLLARAGRELGIATSWLVNVVRPER